MLTKKDLTPEQLEKVKLFAGIYDEGIQKSYGEAYAKFKNKVVDEPYYRAYLNIVKNTARFIKEMGSSDPLSASIIFEYLLWNGYFSKDKQLIYCESGRINNLAITGADIMRGRSVCLNNAEMLTRVLDEMGIEATLMGCRVDTKNIPKRVYTPPIERKIIQEKPSIFERLVSYPLTRVIGNHAVTLVRVGDGYYVSDPTILSFASVNDFLKAKYLDMDLEIELKNWLTFISNEGDRKEIVETIIKSLLLSDHEPISFDLIMELYEKIPRFLDKDKDTLDDFHESNRKDIDTVCQTLKKVKY